ncbi:MAG: glucose-6-phosphate dehydrogenase [Candidatus Paceibacterota bacterium]
MKYFIITGATGDLAITKLYPSLAEIFEYNQYIPDIQFLGAGRKEISQIEYEQIVQNSLINFNGEKDFIKNLQYVHIDFNQIETINKFFEQYNIKLGDEVIWYMAIPPQAFDSVIDTLAKSKNIHQGVKYKLVFEKPFGSDLSSAKSLNQKLYECFREEEIYRVDHYLGKETIQNILALRFGNTMFEPLLNNHYVESISIDVWEERGIDKRADYFDKTGIIKDVLQNHILQTLALITMEAPVTMEAEYIRDEKHKLIKCLKPITNQDVVLGQYVSSKSYKGYLEEEGVKNNSKTETYVQLTAYIDNPRWEGVPIYISTGKRLSENKAEIRVSFKPRFKYFSHIDENCNPQKNELVISIQPNEEVYYTVNAKFPGKGMCIQPVKLHFTYEESFGQKSQGAYTRLIQDILDSDQSLFIRADEIEAAWNYIDILIQENNISNRKLIQYQAGIHASGVVDNSIT